MLCVLSKLFIYLLLLRYRRRIINNLYENSDPTLQKYDRLFYLATCEKDICFCFKRYKLLIIMTLFCHLFFNRLQKKEVLNSDVRFFLYLSYEISQLILNRLRIFFMVW